MLKTRLSTIMKKLKLTYQSNQLFQLSRLEENYVINLTCKFLSFADLSQFAQVSKNISVSLKREKTWYERELNQMLKKVGQYDSKNFKQGPCSNRSIRDKIKHLLENFMFVRDLNNTSELKEKINILRFNKELLVFDLEKQLSNFINWWTNNYSLQNSFVQITNQQEIYELEYPGGATIVSDEKIQPVRINESIRKLCVPLFQPEFRLEFPHEQVFKGKVIHVSIRKIQQITKLPENISQYIFDYMDEEKSNPSLLKITGISKDIWKIIKSYLYDLNYFNYHICFQCYTTGANYFLLPVFPFLS